MVEKGMIDRKLTRHITQWTCVIIVSLPVIAIEMAAQMSKSPEELWILGGMFLERFVVSFDFDQAMVESSSALFIFILGPWYCLVIKKWELFLFWGPQSSFSSLRHDAKHDLNLENHIPETETARVPSCVFFSFYVFSWTTSNDPCFRGSCQHLKMLVGR